MRGLAGGILGGLLGGMLFRGLGFAGDGFAGGGIGFVEILLFAGLIYFVYRWIVNRRRPEGLADGYYQQSVGTGGPSYQSESLAVSEPPSQMGQDLGKGLSHIRQMDDSFDEKNFQDLCLDYFFRIQGAWTNRDMSGVKDLVTKEMLDIIEGDIHRLKIDQKIDKLDNIAVRSVDLVEAWQESGSDFITAKLYANLVDYTVEESTGKVVSGSRTEPVKFEEYWTFTRPVGRHPWQLSAIQQVE